MVKNYTMESLVMIVKIKKLTETAQIPKKNFATDACFDIYANIQSYRSDGEIIIGPHETVKIPTGFATNLPHGYFAAVFARSGLATNQGLRPANCVAVIDEPYTGEWMVPLHNDSDKPRIIQHGDRIAQFALFPYYNVEFDEVNELDYTTRGTNGFGSSGV